MEGNVAPYLQRVEFLGNPTAGGSGLAYPFSVAALQGLGTLRFSTPVTFFVGENGSGKSTLLEALALACRAELANRQLARDDPALAAVQPLARQLRAGWRQRAGRTVLLRAEDYAVMVRGLRQIGQNLDALVERFADDTRVQGYLRGQRRALDSAHGADPDAASHGEGFLRFFEARFGEHWLHLVDEPEAALSPQRQLAFLSLLKQTVAEGGQFIIATHSPLILSFPGATIWSFDDGLREVAFDDLPHVALTRTFLRDPARFWREL